MTKITPDHLARSAFVYIRQSTADQVLNNHESRRRQYGLEERARQLGWQDVVVIDDDLGRSGSGVNRPGFERLLAAICEGRAGAVFAIEASRLARNGRDWHTLIEFCGLVGAIIIDEDGVYEPRHPNDRLLLGMKGTMSELELSILRQRSIEALRQSTHPAKTTSMRLWTCGDAIRRRLSFAFGSPSNATAAIRRSASPDDQEVSRGHRRARLADRRR